MAHVVAVLAEGFEDSEFTVPRDRLREAGHELTVVGRRAGERVTGKRAKARVEVEAAAGDVDPAGFDALLVPGGWSPDRLRTDEDVVDFVRRFATMGRPIAAICHGPQLLIEADAVKGRRLTSYASVRTDLRNAGATWKDAEVVVDANLVTSRTPDDLDAFCDALLQKLDAAKEG